MTEPTTEEQRVIDHKSINLRLRDAAGYTETADITETERPNAEMNDLLRCRPIRKESNAEG